MRVKRPTIPRTLKLRITLAVFAVVLVVTGIGGLAVTFFTYMAITLDGITFSGWLQSWNLGWILLATVGPIAAATSCAVLAYLATARSLLPIRAIASKTNRIANGWVRERVQVDGDSEVMNLARAVNGLAGKFQYVDEHRRSLLAEVTHELRRPLNNVQGYAEMVEQQIMSFTGEIQESASAMQRQVETLARQIDGLRILADADSGDLVLNTAPERLTEVMTLAVEGHLKRAADKGIEITMDLPNSLPPVTVDRHRMFQVVGNLLDNAIAHMPGGGTIDVSGRREGRVVRLMVRDTGAGIPPESLPHVFERFYSANPGRTSDRGGFGLGLTVSKQIVEMHGGRIWAESVEGEGSTFYFTIPVNRKPALRLVEAEESKQSTA